MLLENKIMSATGAVQTQVSPDASRFCHGFQREFIVQANDFLTAASDNTPSTPSTSSIFESKLYKKLLRSIPISMPAIKDIYELVVINACTSRTIRASAYGFDHNNKAWNRAREVSKEKVRKLGEEYADNVRSEGQADPSDLITAAIDHMAMTVPLLFLRVLIGQDLFEQAMMAVPPGSEYCISAFPNVRVALHLTKTACNAGWNMGAAEIRPFLATAFGNIMSDDKTRLIPVQQPGTSNMFRFTPMHPEWTLNGSPGILYPDSETGITCIESNFKGSTLSFWDNAIPFGAFCDAIGDVFSLPRDFFYAFDGNIQHVSFSTKRENGFTGALPPSIKIEDLALLSLSVQSDTIYYLTEFGRLSREDDGTFRHVSYFGNDSIQSIVPDVLAPAARIPIADIRESTIRLLNCSNICSFACRMSRGKRTPIPQPNREVLPIYTYFESMASGDAFRKVQTSNAPYDVRIKEFVVRQWNVAATETRYVLLQPDMAVSLPEFNNCLSATFAQDTGLDTWWANNRKSPERLKFAQLLRLLLDPDRPPTTMDHASSIISVILFAIYLHNIGSGTINTASFNKFVDTYVPGTPIVPFVKQFASTVL